MTDKEKEGLDDEEMDDLLKTLDDLFKSIDWDNIPDDDDSED